MSAAVRLRECLDMLVPLTVDQYHRMIDAGILAGGRPVELLGGVLVRKDRSKSGEDAMTVGHHHAWVVGRLSRWIAGFETLGGDLRIQQPLTLPPDDEPEPDAAVVIAADYRERHPGAGDVRCVIEVSDSSLRHDRTTKQRIYADHAIGQFVIVNLVDGVIEDYRLPVVGAGRYESSSVLRRDQTLRLDAGDGRYVEVAVADLLP